MVCVCVCVCVCARARAPPQQALPLSASARPELCGDRTVNAAWAHWPGGAPKTPMLHLSVQQPSQASSSFVHFPSFCCVYPTPGFNREDAAPPLQRCFDLPPPDSPSTWEGALGPSAFPGAPLHPGGPQPPIQQRPGPLNEVGSLPTGRKSSDHTNNAKPPSWFVCHSQGLDLSQGWMAQRREGLCTSCFISAVPQREPLSTRPGKRALPPHRKVGGHL